MPAQPRSQAQPNPAVKTRYTVLARYGAMRQIATFSTQIRNLGFGEKCILRSDRGTEWGEVISKTERTDGEMAVRPDGIILRRVTPKDYDHRRSIEENEQPKEFEYCAAKIKERELPMQLVSVEHIFGGEKIIFYFLADGRVDFRQLVKDLATEYKTRIELRQIGVRDEARLLAEYEHCGRELCCRTFIKDLEPVTMRMAKLQKTTLDPAKISGRCGRLMCCLRFEDDVYAHLKSQLPRKGTRVRIEDGVGEIINSETLAQTVTVELPEHKLVTVKMSEILEIVSTAENKDKQQGGESQGEGEPGEHNCGECSCPMAQERREERNQGERGQQGDRQQGDRQQSQQGDRRDRRRNDRGGRRRDENQPGRPQQDQRQTQNQQQPRRERPQQPPRPPRAPEPHHEEIAEPEHDFDSHEYEHEIEPEQPNPGQADEPIDNSQQEPDRSGERRNNGHEQGDDFHADEWWEGGDEDGTEEK